MGALGQSCSAQGYTGKQEETRVPQSTVTGDTVPHRSPHSQEGQAEDQAFREHFRHKLRLLSYF